MLICSGRDSPQRLLWWGFAFLLVSVPLVPYRYLPLPLPLHYVPLGVSLLLGLGWGWSRRKELLAAVGGIPLGVPLGVLGLISLVSSAGARQPLLSTAKTLYYFSTGGLLYWVLVERFSSSGRVRGLIYCFVGAAYVVSLYGILEFIAGRDLVYGAVFTPQNEAYRRLSPDPWFGRRILSSIGHPVMLGTYLVLALPVSLSMSFTQPKGWRRGGMLAGSLGVLAALMLSFSRGAWVAAIVSMFCYLKLRGGRYVLLLPLALAIVLGVLFGLRETSGVLVERLQGAYREYVLNFSSTTRAQSLAYVAVIHARHPLLGLGTGMYRFEAYALRRELEVETPLGVLDTPDNMYLMWLAEEGALGLGAGIYVLAALGRRLWRAQKGEGDPLRRELARGFLAAFVGFGVDMLTVTALHFYVTRVVFWLVAGLGVALVGEGERGPEGA